MKTHVSTRRRQPALTRLCGFHRGGRRDSEASRLLLPLAQHGGLHLLVASARQPDRRRGGRLRPHLLQKVRAPHSQGLFFFHFNFNFIVLSRLRHVPVLEHLLYYVIFTWKYFSPLRIYSDSLSVCAFTR